MYTKKELQKMFLEAESIGLDKADLLLDERAAAECNGIGAAWMWDAMVEFLGKMNPCLIIPANIHDIDYCFAPKAEADERFLSNCIKSADATYGWYNPLRYRARHQAKKFYLLLRSAGDLKSVA
jgi:hypothetical protein